MVERFKSLEGKLIKYGLISVGLFWCYKKDFKSINGFNENLRIGEDADLAMRLKKWGKKCITY